MSSEPVTSDIVEPRAVQDVVKVKTEGVDLQNDIVTSTPPSSPPPTLKMPDNSMGPPKEAASASRKRSVDEMHGDAGSKKANADIAPRAPQGTDDNTDDTPTIKTSDSQQSQNARSTRSSNVTIKAESQSQKLPPSGQGSQKKSGKGTKSAPQPAEQTASDDEEDDEDGDDDEDEGSEGEDATDQSEPHQKIQDFDWENLERRYHDRMREFGEREQAILDEFAALVGYFNVWAEAGSGKEVDRSFKRLKTQTTFVRNEESQLESKRQHYIKVVEAFQSALQLLNA